MCKCGISTESQFCDECYEVHLEKTDEEAYIRLLFNKIDKNAIDVLYQRNNMTCNLGRTKQFWNCTADEYKEYLYLRIISRHTHYDRKGDEITLVEYLKEYVNYYTYINIPYRLKDLVKEKYGIYLIWDATRKSWKIAHTLLGVIDNINREIDQYNNKPPIKKTPTEINDDFEKDLENIQAKFT